MPKCIPPRTLLLVDSLGALLSAALLAAVAMTYPHGFGLPQTTLYILSGWAFLYVLSSGYYAYHWAGHQYAWFRRVAVGNLVYGCCTMGLVIYHHMSVTGLGVTYFLLEAAVIGALSYIELKAYRRRDQKS